jgi:glycosyltransferase domain-containing protein
LERWFLSRISVPCEGEHAADPLEKLTVIVPSYCRQPFLLRQIVYWMHPPVKIIILDGSPEPLSSHLIDSVSSHQHITYLHNPVHPADRLYAAQHRINTPYSVLLGDDEFHLRSGLRKAVFYLEKNSEFIGCMGQSIKFYVSQEKAQIYYGSGYAHLKYEVSAESILDRFEYAMEYYNAATCYAVLRTEIWKDSWANLVKTSCHDVFEPQQALLTYAAGKFSTIDHIYWLRSYENESIADHGQFKHLSFPSWFASVAYADERRKVVTAIAAVIQKYARLPAPEAESAARDGLEMFCRFYQRYYHPPSLFSWVRIKGVLSFWLRSVIPPSLYRAMKNRILPDASLDMVQLADIGKKEALALESCKKLFKFEAETGTELQAIESLIFDFYRHY